MDTKWHKKYLDEKAFKCTYTKIKIKKKKIIENFVLHNLMVHRPNTEVHLYLTYGAEG